MLGKSLGQPPGGDAKPATSTTEPAPSSVGNAQLSNKMDYDKKRLSLLLSNSKKSIIDIINMLRSKVSFYGIIKVYDQLEMQKLKNEKMERENELLKDMVRQLRADI